LLAAYDRREWKHWIDADHDCQDTRQEVLIAESLTPPVLDARGCRVLSGTWVDPYTGNTHTDPSALDIDHTIPLKLAAVSGGQAWSPDKKQAYANDLTHPDHLIAIDKRINRSKGARPIQDFHPTQPDARCWYLHAYMGVKRHWDLTYTAAELDGILCELRTCDK
jgi:hypothetical protein